LDGFYRIPYILERQIWFCVAVSKFS
jgi:hypothetical protein